MSAWLSVLGALGAALLLLLKGLGILLLVVLVLLALALELKQDALRQLISEKLSGFKRDDGIAKLQAKVGDDLQNIRISGTVIGGLLGAVLFMVAAMAERLVG